jgi:hypothetical protein
MPSCRNSFLPLLLDCAEPEEHDWLTVPAEGIKNPGAQWRPRLTCPLNSPFLSTLPTMDGARRGAASMLIFELLRVTGFDGFFCPLTRENECWVTLRA